MLSFFNRDPRRGSIERLHQRIAAASRAEILYARLGLPDTLEGRFESLSLHVILVLRRLRVLPPPAGDAGQELVDCFFRLLEVNLRELGTGDTVVPKRMKKLAAAFYAVTRRYDAVLDSRDRPALAQALATGFGIAIEPAAALADYALEAESGLAAADLDDLLVAGPSWPRPDLFVGADR